MGAKKKRGGLIEYGFTGAIDDRNAEYVDWSEGEGRKKEDPSLEFTGLTTDLDFY
jgi:hypothetical protein